jgi:hypothetical protein
MRSEKEGIPAPADRVFASSALIERPGCSCGFNLLSHAIFPLRNSPPLMATLGTAMVNAALICAEHWCTPQQGGANTEATALGCATVSNFS